METYFEFKCKNCGTFFEAIQIGYLQNYQGKMFATRWCSFEDNSSQNKIESIEDAISPRCKSIENTSCGSYDE